MRPTKEEEQELIRYYEERRGQTEHWGKPIPVRPRRGTGPSTVFSLRLTGAELTLFWQEATRRGISVSELIREATLREVAATSESGGLKEAAASLRRIADQIERDTNGADTAAYVPATRRPALAASEEKAPSYEADPETRPAPKRAPRRNKS